jgi:hypothetical protein
MKPYHKLFSIVLLFPLFSLAQSNYKPGYMVTLKGDTLHGFINYREWNSNPDAISFKKMLSDNKAQKYTPDEISFFNINGFEAYEKYSGPISMDVVNTDRLTTGKDTSFKIGEFFFKVLQKGKNVTLYAYSDDLKSRYFIGDSPEFKPKELVYRIYQANDASGTEKTYSDETYLKQLNALAIKYNALNDDLAHNLEKADYQKPILLLITGKINNISKDEFKSKYDDQTASYFYGGIGINVATTTPSAGGSYLAAGGKSYTSILPVAKAGINIFVNPNTKKLSFRFELSVTAIKYNSVYDNKFSPYVNITYGYTNLAVALSPQIIYNFYNAKELKIYAGGGIELTKYKSFGKKYIDNKDGSTVPTSADPFNLNTFSIPVMAKAGFIINDKLDFSFDYLFAGPVSDDYVFRLNTSSFQVGVNYKFK